MTKNKRILFKTITWRIFAIIVIFSVTYLFTNSEDALHITLIVNFINSIGYFLHEKVWEKK